MVENIRKSICAGALIGIAGVMLVSIGNLQTSSVLFSFALLYICLMGLNLYTGKIGWATSKEKQPVQFYLVMLVGNLIGATGIALIALLANPNLQTDALSLVQKKAELSYLQLLMKGIFCGIMMYLAVWCFKNNSNGIKYAGIFFCIPIFILSGFEHSIADCVYMSLAGYWLFLPKLLVIVLGNTFGSIGSYYLFEYKK